MIDNQFEKLTVVKVGGGVLEDVASLAGFLDRFVALPDLKFWFMAEDGCNKTFRAIEH